MPVRQSPGRPRQHHPAAVAGGKPAELAHEAAGGGGQVERLAPSLDGARVEPGQVEQVGCELRSRGTCSRIVCRNSSACPGRGPRRRAELEESPEREERRAQLVRRVRDEFPARAFELPAGPASGRTRGPARRARRRVVADGLVERPAAMRLDGLDSSGRSRRRRSRARSHSRRRTQRRARGALASRSRRLTSVTAPFTSINPCESSSRRLPSSGTRPAPPPDERPHAIPPAPGGSGTRTRRSSRAAARHDRLAAESPLGVRISAEGLVGERLGAALDADAACAFALVTARDRPGDGCWTRATPHEPRVPVGDQVLWSRPATTEREPIVIAARRRR